jgi:hypothetical protein
VRQPSLLVVLQYARAAMVPIEVLVDDDLNLPKPIVNKSNKAEDEPKPKLNPGLRIANGKDTLIADFDMQLHAMT